MLHEHSEFLEPYPQGRHLDRHDIESVVEVLAKFPVADEIFRVYKNAHPEIEIFWVRTTPEIDKAIEAVAANE